MKTGEEGDLIIEEKGSQNNSDTEEEEAVSQNAGSEESNAGEENWLPGQESTESEDAPQSEQLDQESSGEESEDMHQNEQQDEPSEEKDEHAAELADPSFGQNSGGSEEDDGISTQADPEQAPVENNKGNGFLKTGIPGFDDLIDTGGIPKGTSILLSGGPGSGKTTFSLQTLMHGASNGEKCIYLSFEESVERLKGHMRNYGWDPDKLIDEGNLIMKRMDPFEISRSVEALLAKARGELLIELDEVEGLIPKGFSPNRIVLDSLSAVSAAFAGREEGYRIYIEQLFKALESIGATSFLITEINHDMNTFSRTGVEEFLSDGVIAFYNIRKGNIRVSATEIVKLRGVSHKKRIVPFNISSGTGIEVFPTEEIFVD